MNRIFNCLFASRIAEFIAQKHALGFPYGGSEVILSYFDRFCCENFAVENILSKELCLTWAVRRDTEGNNALRNRLSVIREFAKYLNRLGEPAFIIPNFYAKKSARLVPHIYSEEEIAMIWEELDNTKPRDRFPVRHFVIPAIMRLLYCCGLRPCEARKLRVDDVDLLAGKLYIRESKGHKDRIIMLADDMRDYLVDYNEKVCRLLPGRQWFFPSSNDELYTKEWLENTFCLVRKKLNIPYSGTTPPRLYDFRHTFATHRLYLWMREGKDLTTMTAYLSAYMGHVQLTDTYYYIHLVPGQLETMSGLDFSRYESLLPEVELDD
ncbi:integrase [Clostridia bacterium]|nr:integrase [Clostridia bacterium]